MRDIKLARKQFFTGLIFLFIALLIGYFFIKPQYVTYQTHKVLLNNTLSGVYLGDLNDLPMISPSQPQLWQNNVLKKFSLASVSTKTILVSINGDIKHANQSENFPRLIKKIPITLKIHGSFTTFKNFMQTIQKEFPLFKIQSAEFKKLNKNSQIKDQPPQWEGIIKLDIYVVGESL